MNKINKMAEAEVSRLSELQKRASAILASSPSGDLHFHQRGNRLYFDVVFETDESGKKDRKYLSRNSKDLVPYIRKYCAACVRDIAAEGIRTLKKDPYSYDFSATQEEYKRFESLFGELLPPYFVSRETRLRKWQDGPFVRSGMEIKPEDAVKTDRGELVRSKNEALAANCLNRLGIPYHYEEKLLLSSGKVCFPDFTVKDPESEKVYYIEIFGMMSNPEYLAKASRKLCDYENEGIYVGDRLMVFFEFEDRKFDVRQFENAMRQKMPDGRRQ